MTKIDLPFLSRERGKTGKWFYRFQRHGKKVRIQGVPGSPEWIAHYVHLRDSTPMTEPPMVNVGTARTKPNSFGRLCEKYLEHYGKQVSAGQRSQSTLTMKNHLLGTLATTLGDEPARSIRRSDLIRARDEMASAPAKADNVIRAVRAMFNWAVDMDYVAENPAIRIPKL